MLCEDVRRALPGDEDSQLLEHTRSCGECAKLAEAYAADGRALKAYAADRETPAAMSGFADSLMSRLAAEPVVAKTETQAEILRPNFNFSVVLAIAAAILLTVSLGLVLSSPDDGRAPGFAKSAPTPPEIVPTETPLVADALVVDALVPEALPAPRRHERAPAPLRARSPRGIVPVDGRESGRGGDLLNVLQDLQRVFPNWDPSGMDRRVPGLKPGEREVRF